MKQTVKVTVFAVLGLSALITAHIVNPSEVAAMNSLGNALDNTLVNILEVNKTDMAATNLEKIKTNMPRVELRNDVSTPNIDEAFPLVKDMISDVNDKISDAELDLAGADISSIIKMSEQELKDAKYLEMLGLNNIATQFKLPVTRGSKSEIYGRAYKMGLLSEYLGDDIQLQEDTRLSDYGKLVEGRIDMEQVVSRGEYANIVMKWKNFVNIPDFLCCMGDEPDFSDLVDDYTFAEDVKAAAMAGLLCTREKTRYAEDMIMEDLDKYIWKLAQIQPSRVFDSTTNYTQHADLQDFVMDIAEGNKYGMSEVYNEMLWETYKANMLPLTYSNTLALDQKVTLGNLLQILIGSSDIHLVYNDLNRKNEVCIACSFLGVDSFYEE